MDWREIERKSVCWYLYIFTTHAHIQYMYIYIYRLCICICIYVYMYICIYKYQYCMHLPFNISLAQKAEVAAIPSPEARDVVFILDLGCSVFVSCCTVNDQKKTVDPLFSSGF